MSDGHAEKEKRIRACSKGLAGGKKLQPRRRLQKSVPDPGPGHRGHSGFQGRTRRCRCNKLFGPDAEGSICSKRPYLSRRKNFLATPLSRILPTHGREQM